MIEKIAKVVKTAWKIYNTSTISLGVSIKQAMIIELVPEEWYEIILCAFEDPNHLNDWADLILKKEIKQLRKEILE